MIRCPFLKADSGRVVNVVGGEETRGTEVSWAVLLPVQIASSVSGNILSTLRMLNHLNLLKIISILPLRKLRHREALKLD